MIPGMPVAEPYRHHGYVIDRAQSNRVHMNIEEVRRRAKALLDMGLDDDPEAFHDDRDELVKDVLLEIASGAVQPSLLAAAVIPLFRSDHTLWFA